MLCSNRFILFLWDQKKKNVYVKIRATCGQDSHADTAAVFQIAGFNQNGKIKRTEKKERA